MKYYNFLVKIMEGALSIDLAKTQHNVNIASHVNLQHLQLLISALSLGPKGFLIWMVCDRMMFLNILYKDLIIIWDKLP